MADAMVERRPVARFFCHRCNVEFEDVLQDYTCPYCASGFIEQLEEDTLGQSDDFSDADMSNIDELSNMDDMSSLADSDDIQHIAHGVAPMLNDLAFLMSGGRIRGTGRRETLMEQLVWMIGGPRPGTGAVTAGAPFVFVGAPGDYVFGGEGLDAVVTQLLGQLENSGPPPLPRDQIAAIPSVPVTEEQVAASASCSICWENFQLGENVSRLECEHVFHSLCISPWLQLHATCPICRRSLLPEAPPAPAPASGAAPPSAQPRTDAAQAQAQPQPQTQTQPQPQSQPNGIILRFPASVGGRRVVRRRPTLVAEGWLSPQGSSTSSSSTSVGTSNPSSRSRSSASADSEECNAQYNMDIDFD